MIDDKVLQKITSSVLKASNPKKIIMFGSYARKEAEIILNTIIDWAAKIIH